MPEHRVGRPARDSHRDGRKETYKTESRSHECSAPDNNESLSCERASISAAQKRLRYVKFRAEARLRLQRVSFAPATRFSPSRGGGMLGKSLRASASYLGIFLPSPLPSRRCDSDCVSWLMAHGFFAAANPHTTPLAI